MFLRSRLPFLSTAFASVIASVAAEAGELKVDINRDSRNNDAVTEVGYTRWSADRSGSRAVWRFFIR